MKNVILLNGLPRVGKDTVADYLVDNHGYTKLSFATELKNIMCRTFGITREALDDYKNNPNTYTLTLTNNENNEVIFNTDFRDVLRYFGTEGMKPTFGDSIWARLTYDKIKEKIEKDSISKFVIPDFRFSVEYITSDDYDVSTVLVKDDRELPTEGHGSDVELYKNNFVFDYTIKNLGTLEELERKTKKLEKSINLR